MPSNSFPAPVSKGRKTRVRFDVDDIVCIEPTWGLTRHLDEIGRLAVGEHENVHFSRNVGWQLLPLFAQPHRNYERTQGDAFRLLPSMGSLDIPAGFAEVNNFRAPDDQPNAAVGAAADLADFGDPYIAKQVVAGTNWDSTAYRLAPDQAAFPGPALDRDSFIMDRVARGRDNHEPWQTVTFVAGIPGAAQNLPDKPFKFYFGGPPSSNNICRGTGIYCAVPTADGIVNLYEYGLLKPSFTAYGWIQRDSFSHGSKTGTVGRAFFLTVIPAAGGSKGTSGNLCFRFGIAAETHTLTKSLNVFAQAAGPGHVYHCINDDRGPAQNLQPIRVDMRRDLRGRFQVYVGGFVTPGTLYDDPVVLPFYPQNPDTMRVEVYGYMPSGTSVAIELQDEDSRDINGNPTHVAITASASGDLGSTGTGIYGERGFYADFPISVRVRSYRAKYTLTGTDLGTGSCNESPIIRQTRYIKEGLHALVSPGEIAPVLNNGHLSIIGAESDAAHERGSVSFEDLTADASVLALRAGQCAVIDTQYDPDDASKRVILQRGYVEEAHAFRKGTSGRVYPDPEWCHYDVSIESVCRRGREVYAPTGWSWAQDPNAPLISAGGIQVFAPYKASDVLKLVLQWMGFPDDLVTPADSMINIADRDIRMFPVGPDDQLRVEIFSDLLEFARRIARDYFGEALLFDPNQGNYGKWITVAPPRAPYQNVAYFTSQGSGPLKLQHVLEGYADTVIVSNDTTTGSTVPTCYIVKHTHRSYVKPPEFNKITVSGVGDFSGGQQDRPTQTLINHESYNDILDHPTADTDSPDYLGRVVEAFYFDPCLTTPEAVNFVTRRLFDIGAHGYKMRTFQGPLFFIEHEEDATRVRPLRFGDPVQVNGEQYIVRNVNPDYESDAAQMAIYELQQPRI